MEMKEDIGVCTLEISDATTEDSGEYTVQLSNEVIHTHSLSPYSPLRNAAEIVDESQTEYLNTIL